MLVLMRYEEQARRFAIARSLETPCRFRNRV
jgi:hypothetical protein